VKFTDGKISSKSGYDNDATTYQISVPVQPGNSGGPLFDSKGNLVGVVNAKFTKGDNVSYAIKSPVLKTLFRPESQYSKTDINS
jgi:S1-C subfamily serine protease